MEASGKRTDQKIIGPVISGAAGVTPACLKFIDN